MVLENNENHLADEIDKVKDRLKTITNSLVNQQTFLRLIIQVHGTVNFRWNFFPRAYYTNSFIYLFFSRKWKSKPKKTKWTKACHRKK